MSDYARMVGGGSGGVYIDLDPFSVADANQAKNGLDLISTGSFLRNVGGIVGSNEISIDGSTTGDKDLWNWIPPIETDNTSSRISNFTDANSAVLKVRFRFALRVSNAGINITPKLKYGTTISGITNVATLSGHSACSATSAAYTGTAQIQDVLVTLPSGVNLWRPMVTVAGTPVAGYEIWAALRVDILIQLP